MESDRIASLLGRPLTDPLVEELLAQYTIRRRPQVDLAEGNPDSQDWVMNRSAGIEFGFEDEAAFLEAGDVELGSSPMLLTQVYLYLDQDDVKAYRAQLPFGLQTNDDREAVQAKLAEWESTRRSYQRDTWELPEFRLIINYVDDGKRIGFLLFQLRRPQREVTDDSVDRLPSVDQILGVLERPLNDQEVQGLFAPLGMKDAMEDEDEARIANFRNSYGFELEFSSEDTVSGELIFSSAAFYRDREMGARRWRGSLPFDLEFDDSPEVMLRKIGHPPTILDDEEFDGYAIWRLPDYSLQVQFSTMYNWILSVQVTASSFWSDEDGSRLDEDD